MLTGERRQLRLAPLALLPQRLDLESDIGVEEACGVLLAGVLVGELFDRKLAVIHDHLTGLVGGMGRYRLHEAVPALTR